MNLTRSRHLWLFVALAAAAVVAAMTFSAGSTVSADAGDHAIVTFTKWNTQPDPTIMKGVVGGDVGAGTYSGQIRSVDATIARGQITRIEADYTFQGSNHTFTARLHVWIYGGKFAVLNGAVTEGWSKGSTVTGMFDVVPCTEAPNGVCFRGYVIVSGAGSN